MTNSIEIPTSESQQVITEEKISIENSELLDLMTSSREKVFMIIFEDVKYTMTLYPFGNELSCFYKNLYHQDQAIHKDFGDFDIAMPSEAENTEVIIYNSQSKDYRPITLPNENINKQLFKYLKEYQTFKDNDCGHFVHYLAGMENNEHQELIENNWTITLLNQEVANNISAGDFLRSSTQPVEISKNINETIVTPAFTNMNHYMMALEKDLHLAKGGHGGELIVSHLMPMIQAYQGRYGCILNKK